MVGSQDKRLEGLRGGHMHNHADAWSLKSDLFFPIQPVPGSKVAFTVVLPFRPPSAWLQDSFPERLKLAIALVYLVCDI